MKIRRREDTEREKKEHKKLVSGHVTDHGQSLLNLRKELIFGTGSQLDEVGSDDSRVLAADVRVGLIEVRGERGAVKVLVVDQGLAVVLLVFLVFTRFVAAKWLKMV